jgi:heme ABC exporter ATP-binding subunit CcmA
VLRGVDLRLERSEVVALLGRNGSGKTTLLRIVATLLRPTRGGGTVLGHDLLRDTDAVRGQIGFLGHTNGVYPDLTAAENLEFTLRMIGESVDAHAIGRALEVVGLSSERDTRTREFSAGMQRRLALARFRLLAPALLLLDEPYSSLDPGGAAMLTALIDDTRRRGGAAILVTHDITRARAVADALVALEDGRLVAVRPNDLPPADTFPEGDVLGAPSSARSAR